MDPRADPNPPPRPPLGGAAALTLGAALPPADAPTAETVLRWVTEAKGPWFPSTHARATGLPRGVLDAPLAELRNTGLIRVAAWEKGAGQGYVATADGERVAGRGARPEPEEPPAPSPVAGILDLRPPLVTPLLVAVNVGWFVVAVLVALRWGMPLTAALSGGSTAVLERVGAVSAPDLLRGDWWRLVTCCFVHIGFWHLALNTIGLGVSGPVAELLWGRWRTLAIYLLAGLGGSCLAMAHRPLVLPAEIPVVLAGASGAIWGVMGAVLAWFLIYRDDLAPDLADDWGRRLVFAFLLNAGVSLLPQVSWEAHLGGGVVGFVAAGLMNTLRHGAGRRRWVAGGLLAAVPVACLAGLAAAMQEAEEWAPLRTRVHAARPATTDAPPRELNVVLAPAKPEAAKPVRWAAVRVWLVNADVREKARAEARAEIDGLRAQLAACDAELAARPDPLAARAREVVAARVRELDRLRELTDAAELPTATDWQLWGARRRDADAFWADAPAP